MFYFSPSMNPSLSIQRRWADSLPAVRSLRWRRAVMAAMAAVAVLEPPTLAQTETISVDLRLRTGGALSGPVVDYNDDGLVIVHEKTPYVFAWRELVSGNAIVAHRALYVLSRGGENRLTAADRFALGEFALDQGRNDLAVREFLQARRLDATFAPRIAEAFGAFRRRRESRRSDLGLQSVAQGGVDDSAESRDPNRAEPPSRPIGDSPIAGGLLSDRRDEVLEVYRRFGEKVREVLGKSVQLVESEHFLVWTDWERMHHDRLTAWCEAMYDALVEQFGLDLDEPVFPAKCPVFAFQSKRHFQRFAQEFDGYAGVDALGYTRSIQASGHVHVALLRQGRSPEDFDRFSCTLVHEGTHAFLHRLYASRLIPHWVNEGLAEMVAEGVLGDRCPAGENAALLARQFVRYDWPLGDWLRSAGPIEVHQYPLAHSVVLFLHRRGRDRFNGFVQALKQGETLSVALAKTYDGLTLDTLEQRWRVWITGEVSKAQREEKPPERVNLP